VICPLLLL